MASPYIYVNADLPAEFEPPLIESRRVLPMEELRELVQRNDSLIETASQGSVEERVLAIFQGPEVLFGDAGFIPANQSRWIELIRSFTSGSKPIEFVTMAFPYKSPNPLKTGREAPDLGEAMMLRRFQAVLDAVRSVYPPGGRLTVLEEGILGRCQGVDQRRIAAYRAGIGTVVALSGVDPDTIIFHSLDAMVTEIPNFEARWIFEQERMRELWQQGDPQVRSAHATTTAAQRASVPTLDFDPHVLAHAYDPSRTDSALRYVRDYLDKVAHRQFFAYRALLALRDSTGFLSDLRPNALKLTVSPKPENLAVVPVNRWSRVLPYHGVPVLDERDKWEIRYLGGLGAGRRPVEALHLEGDADPMPIGYRMLG